MTEISDKTREMRLRRLAKRVGHRIEKSRRGYSINNRGGYQLIEEFNNSPREGWDYELTLDGVEYWLGQIAAKEAA